MNTKFNNEPIILNENTDLVGNLIYSDYLYEEIEKSLKDNQVETIALYGDWGIGKSSIIDTVQSKYLHKNVKFITYSAWKYSSDDFRKSFIINLDNDYEDEVYSTTTKTNYSLNEKNKKWIIALIIFLGVIIVLSLFFYKGQDIYSFLFNILSTTLVVSVVSSAVKAIIVETSVSKKKIYSPKEFSDAFEKIMKCNLLLNDYVFVIDDLDRCSYKDVLDILSCIHGFMKIKGKNLHNYLFLIPIDKNRLKYALKEERNYSNEEQNKYLDKMFDISIIVDNAGVNNIFDMIKTISDQQKISIKSISIDLLATFYIETPRDVYKALEKIKTELYIQKQKYKKGYLSKEIREAEIVKLFILRNKWPNVYDELLNCTNALILDSKLIEIVNTKSEFRKIEDFNNLKNFVRMSQDITIKNIHSYHYLKSNDVYYDVELSSLYLSGDLESVDNQYGDDQLINTFAKTFRDKCIDEQLMAAYITNLMKSYIWLLTRLKKIQDLYDNVSPGEICNIYCDSISLLPEHQDDISYVNMITDPFKLLFSYNSFYINKFINIFISKIVFFSEPFDVIAEALLNEKNHAVLKEENIKKSLYISIKNRNINDESLLFIFKNLEKYRYIISFELWTSLLSEKFYSCLLYLSEFDNMNYGDGIVTICKSMNIIPELKFNNLNSYDQGQIDILNNELLIFTNFLYKTNSLFDEIINEYIPPEMIGTILKAYYNNVSKFCSIEEGLAKYITAYDNKFDLNNQMNVYDSIHMYSTRRNGESIQFILYVLNNIKDIHIKYDAFVVAAGVTSFCQEISQYFIDCCNKKENPTYYLFVEMMENANGPYRFLHKPFNGAETQLSKQKYITNLKPLFNKLKNDVYQEIVPYLSLAEIIDNKNFINDLNSIRTEIVNNIFSKISSLEDLLVFKNVPNFKGKRTLIDSKLNEVLFSNKELYKDNLILNEFSSKKQKEIISTIYSE